ncbi:MAG: hypothetical protein OXH00_07960 [Candidatus Poribacteria bacterium]|nr:hypothetical protein [Candidatus Poribacteria bacterium]
MQFIETLYVDPLLNFLVNTTMKSFVIFAVAGVFAFCLRRKSAAVCGSVWGMAIIGCLIVSLFFLLIPKWKVNVLPQAPIRPEMPQLVKNAQPLTIPTSVVPNQPPSTVVSSTEVPPIPSQPIVNKPHLFPTMPWTDWITIVWGGVGLLIFVRLVVGIGAVWHISIHGNDFSRAIEQVGSNWNCQASVRLSNRSIICQKQK